MSTTSTTSDDPDFEVASSSSPPTSTSFNYAVTHVFLPVQLPSCSDYTLENEHSLARAVYAAAHDYGTHVYGTSERAHWHRITKLLDNVQASFQSAYMDIDQAVSQLRGMQTGGMSAVYPQISGRADDR